jgi:hypothetical protein
MGAGNDPPPRERHEPQRSANWQARLVCAADRVSPGMVEGDGLQPTAFGLRPTAGQSIERLRRGLSHGGTNYRAALQRDRPQTLHGARAKYRADFASMRDFGGLHDVENGPFGPKVRIACRKDPRS